MGLILVRELDERLGLGELIAQHLELSGEPIIEISDYWLLMAESHLTRRLFSAMVSRMAAFRATG